MSTTTLASLGAPDGVVAALAPRGITEPFPIHTATIPPALEGRDLSGKAPTGSGKTIAFGVPMVARVTRSAPKKPHGLVLAPTRELAIQVAEELAIMAGDLRVIAVYGGAGIEPQIKKLRAGIDIVVATPGRLIDLLDRDCIRLDAVTFAVVDEADRMADMGFLPDVKRILDQTRDDRQTVLFSATLDGAIDTLVQRYQRNPVVHELEEDRSGEIVHHMWLAPRPERVALTAQIVDRLGPTVVFCRTKHGSDRVARQLGNGGVKAAAIHGNRSQAQRERALEAFHRGDVQALVATDVAARGIHVDGVLGVVHFDLPHDEKDYIHRSGRTGRAGMTGTVITLIDANQRKDAVKIKKGAGIGDVEITDPDVASLPEGPQQAFRPKPRRKATVKDLAPRPPANSPSRSKPKPKPQAKADRQRDWDEPNERAKPKPKSASRQSRAERRERQFTDEERAARAAANERREARSQAGEGKPRPSGAARRKAKRDQQVASGEAPTRSKKRRSGKPRPPAKHRSR